MGVSQHVCEAAVQMIPPAKDILGPSTKDWSCKNTQAKYIHPN